MQHAISSFICNYNSNEILIVTSSKALVTTSNAFDSSSLLLLLVRPLLLVAMHLFPSSFKGYNRNGATRGATTKSPRKALQANGRLLARGPRFFWLAARTPYWSEGSTKSSPIGSAFSSQHLPLLQTYQSFKVHSSHVQVPT